MVYGRTDYSVLEDKIEYHFKNREHLDVAFTHSSYVNEFRGKKLQSYERYEFLGDAVLEFIMSSELFRRYPEKSEGELTKLRASLVCEYTLSQITGNLGFGDYLYLSHGEELTGGRNRSSILCDLFESVLGAIYLDGGLKPARDYVVKYLLTNIEEKILFHDSKSILQEYVQKNGCSLNYKEISVTGPDHCKTYEIAAVIINQDGTETMYESGIGNNKKNAEQIAAHKTLIKLGVVNHVS
ncbi:MAG: ribonuclease III [Eubacterium sp.]|nr:ribonuclease III [Eubacterium sp.]